MTTTCLALWLVVLLKAVLMVRFSSDFSDWYNSIQSLSSQWKMILSLAVGACQTWKLIWYWQRNIVVKFLTAVVRLAEIVSDLCDKWGCKMIEFNGEEDHIHLLFQYYPQMELPKFISNLKSISSRRLRNEFSERVDKFYGKAVFWNESYFILVVVG